MTFLAGAILGLAGSAHCAAMCGPLLLAIAGGGTAPRSAALRRTAAYHGARVLMYVVLAIPAGYAGRMLGFTATGRAVAICAGALLIAAAFGSALSRWIEPLSRTWSNLIVRAGARTTAMTRRSPVCAFAALGMVNGLLPCGLVYAAIAAAAATGTVSGSIAFMAGFGMATVPALLAVTFSAAAVPARLRRRLRFAAPAVMALAGVLLIARAVFPPETAHHHHGFTSSSTAR